MQSVISMFFRILLKVTPSTTTTTTSTTKTSKSTTSTTATTTIRDEEIESSSPGMIPPTILPASTSKWKEVEDASTILMVKPFQTLTTIGPKVELANEIIEETAKDGSKLLVVQALQRAAKNFPDTQGEPKIIGLTKQTKLVKRCNLHAILFFNKN